MYSLPGCRLISSKVKTWSHLAQVKELTAQVGDGGGDGRLQIEKPADVISRDSLNLEQHVFEHLHLFISK